MRVVVALGGNALLERGERPDAVIQQRHVRQAVAALAPLEQGVSAEGHYDAHRSSCARAGELALMTMSRSWPA